MPKLTWEDFNVRHPTAWRVDTLPPVLPKALQDSLRRSGVLMPEPSAALERALGRTLAGDWAIRSTHQASDERRSVYRKTDRRVTVIHIRLADSTDVERLVTLVGEVTALRKGMLRRRGLRAGKFDYDRGLFFRLAGLFPVA